MGKESTVIQIKRDNATPNMNAILENGELATTTTNTEKIEGVGDLSRLYIGGKDTSTIENSNTVAVKYSDVSGKALSLGDTSVGSNIQPIYIADGIPTPIDNIVEQSVSSSAALTDHIPTAPTIVANNLNYTPNGKISRGSSISSISMEDTPIFGSDATRTIVVNEGVLHIEDSTQDNPGTITYYTVHKDNGVLDNNSVEYHRVKVIGVPTITEGSSTGNTQTPVYIDSDGNIKECVDIPYGKNVGKSNQLIYSKDRQLRGGISFLSGISTPSSSLGSDGDFYFQY